MNPDLYILATSVVFTVRLGVLGRQLVSPLGECTETCEAVDQRPQLLRQMTGDTFVLSR